MTKLEAEQKYRIETFEPVKFQLSKLGASFVEAEVQVDQYFRHPCRDFRATDEALRMRRSGERTFITYKGPKLPGPIKTRPEIELPLVAGTEDSWVRIWQHLGFSDVLLVKKQRDIYQLTWEGHLTTVAFDRVDGLGFFVEVERVVEPDELPQAQTSILHLASELGLTQIERRSYLSMLLESQR